MDTSNFFWVVFIGSPRQPIFEMLDLLELFPQPVRMSQSVEFGPQPNAGRN
jgi:hypothetical protein